MLEAILAKSKTDQLSCIYLPKGTRPGQLLVSDQNFTILKEYKICYIKQRNSPQPEIRITKIRNLKSEIRNRKMLTGFSKIIEERIRKAQKKGAFENLEGAGKPLKLEEDSHIAEDLRLAHKILKNANCLPPEIELKKEIQRTEDLLSGMQDTAQKHRTLKKLNYLIMKLNAVRDTTVELEMPQQYSLKLVDRLESKKRKENA